MTTEFWLRNASNETIRVESIIVLSHKIDFHQYIQPNREHQFIVYQGPAPTDIHDDNAEIIYRCERTNDYFRNQYNVRFSCQSDATYSIDRLTLEGFTHDI